MTTLLLGILGPIISYLIGSIPFGYIIARLKGIDVRQHGSGNIGATNVGRVLGKGYGVAVYILDLAKGFVPVYFASKLFDHPFPMVICGLAAILGHVFPIYLRFKGGKAVATSCGVFLWLAPLALLIAGATWIIITLCFRYVSLASIVGALALIIAIIILGHDPFGSGRYLTIFAALIALLVILRHKSNIKRLLSGSEPKAW
ncbi:MAG TPA: glycerol-3-phosphate 1-O-acyltransferase PlsY [Candidatus Brocadiales bacterium]|nr:glycerol-3-phosphate 1-O-acyltransferase PlsY [Candidatus Brocadiales bacterium]